MDNLTEKSAQARYTSLEATRQAVLDRAREAAKLTIPSLVPPSGHAETSSLPTPYQAVGARGVNSLSSKLLLSLLPPNTPFFRLTVDDQTAKALDATGERTRGEVEDVLASLERLVQTEIEGTHVRVAVFEALKQLLVAGNVLAFMPPEGGMRVFSLERYVCVRDPMGTPIEILTKESVAPAALPEELLALVDDSDTEKAAAERSVDIYTHLIRDPKKRRWRVYQELKGKVVPGSEGHYPLDACPWMPLRFIRIDGENYGRGYVEEYLGDLRSLEGLSQALLEGAAAAAKVLFLVRPNSTTRSKTLAKAPNGAIVDGDANDVSTLQVQKYNDFRVALEQAQSIEKRLEYAFLMTASIQRSGERVTAEEVRRLAQDLEQALGGVYALLTQEFQLPLVQLLMKRLQRQGRFPALPEKRIRPAIVAGMDALGRGNDLANLTGLLNDLAPFMEVLQGRINPDEIIKRFASARGVPIKGLLLPAEQVAQANQQQQMQAVMQKAAPGAIQSIVDGMVQQGGAPEMMNGASAQADPGP